MARNYKALDYHRKHAASFKVGFHYPSSRPEYTGVRFPLPELTARVDGWQKMHPSSRAVNSARELGPWTRVVETDLYTFMSSECSFTWSTQTMTMYNNKYTSYITTNQCITVLTVVWPLQTLNHSCKLFDSEFTITERQEIRRLISTNVRQNNSERVNECVEFNVPLDT